MHDLRFAIRLFRRRPWLTAVVVTTLAVGLGAMLAAFAAVDRMLLQKPALHDPDRLVLVWETSRKEPDKQQLVSPADFFDLHASGAFSSAAAWMGWNFNLTGEGTPERLRGALVSEEFFTTLGRGGVARDVVISHALWQRVFGGVRDVVGRRITLSGDRFTIAAVMPADFAFPDRETDVWLPIVWGTHFQRDDREGRNLRVVARLRDGITPAQADAIVRTTIATPEGFSARAALLHEEQTREIRPTLLVILAAAAGILAIGCANVVNLMLMLGAARRRELATRVALGGSVLRILRQSMAEGCIIGGAAAMGGIALAMVALRVLTQMQLRLPEMVLGFLAAILVGVVSTTIPAALLGWRNGISALRASHQIAAPGGRLRNALVMTQVALMCALLVSGGVLVKSFLALMAVDPGFDPRNVVTARVWLPGMYDTSARQRVFFDALLDRLRQLPDVRGAAMIQDLPLRRNAMTFDLAIEGSNESQAAYRVVSDGYFDVMRIPILRGRGFHPRDDERAPHVFVINRALARRAFAGSDAIGRRVRVGDDGAWGTIVGIAGDVKQMGLDADDVPAIYEPLAQKEFDWLRWTTLVLRTDRGAPPLATSIRRAVMGVDPNQPVSEIRTLEEILGETVVTQRLSAWIVAALGSVAFLIALAGIGGVLSYAVALRSRELGVRLALGARPIELVRLVLRHAARLVVPGVLAGCAIAVSVSPLLDRLLFRVAALDGVVYFGVTAAVIVAAALASLVPARRAASVDPVSTLRVD